MLACAEAIEDKKRFLLKKNDHVKSIITDGEEASKSIEERVYEKLPDESMEHRKEKKRYYNKILSLKCLIKKKIYLFSLTKQKKEFTISTYVKRRQYFHRGCVVSCDEPSLISTQYVHVRPCWT